MEDAPEGTTISELLERGDIDAFIAPRAPSLAGKNNPNIGWLFPDPIAAGRDYFKRTGIFPIMHVAGIRRELVEQHPWLPAAVFKAFQESKAKCLEALEDTAATKVTLPFVEEQLRAARELMGRRFLVLRARPEPQGAGDASCVTTTRKACRRGWSRRRSCSIRRRMRASRSSQRALRAGRREAGAQSRCCT